MITRPEAQDTEAQEAGPQRPSLSPFGDHASEAIRLLCGDRRHVESFAIRRALADCMRAWPGPADACWWRWLVETGRSLGYSTRAVDASPGEIFELSRHGVAAVTLRDGNDTRLLVVTGVRRRKFRVTQLPSERGPRSVSQSELLASLGGASPTAVRRWVVLDPMADDVIAAGASGDGGPPRKAHDTMGHNEPAPFSRLWGFLRPEWSDIWIVLVFASVIGLLTLATPIAVEALVNTVAFGTLLQPLVVLSAILLVFLGFAAALRFVQRFVVELLQRRIFARVAARLAWQLPRVRADQAHDYSPRVVNYFFDVVTMQKIVAQLALDGLTVVLTVGMGMLVLAFYHPWLLAFDAVLLLFLAFNVLVLGRGAVGTSIAESRSKYQVAGWLEELIRCPTTFKGAGGADCAVARADQLTTEYLLARQAHYRVLMRQIVMGLAMEAMASACLLALGGFLVIQGQMTLGQLVAAELIVTLIVAAVAKLDKQFEGFYDLLTSMDKLGHLFDVPIERTSGVTDMRRSSPAGLSLRGVSFSYEGGPQLLQDLSGEVAPGEIVAITGAAGVGKSTLLDLLFRLREPQSGRILLDDLDFADLRPDALRRDVCLVRGLEVFDGTLAENVHLDRGEVSTADVRAALRRVGLDDAPAAGELPAVAALPVCHLDAHLGCDGRPLSDSQARRLMLARALVSKPRMLLIDGLLDTFSDDDAERLLEELKRSRATCTTLIVTGRRLLSEKCDRTWELS